MKYPALFILVAPRRRLKSPRADAKEQSRAGRIRAVVCRHIEAFPLDPNPRRYRSASRFVQLEVDTWHRRARLPC
jgi:hypothetical protein